MRKEIILTKEEWKHGIRLELRNLNILIGNDENNKRGLINLLFQEPLTKDLCYCCDDSYKLYIQDDLFGFARTYTKIEKYKNDLGNYKDYFNFSKALYNWQINNTELFTKFIESCELWIKDLDGIDSYNEEDTFVGIDNTNIAISIKDLPAVDRRLMFLIFTHLKLDKPDLLVLIEPEIGFNPANLHIVANYIKMIAEKTQVIITTQSPTFLDHFDIEDIIGFRKLYTPGQIGIERLKRKDYCIWLEKNTVGELWNRNIIPTIP